MNSVHINYIWRRTAKYISIKSGKYYSYFFNVTKRELVTLYCASINAVTPHKKQADEFILNEYNRADSPIFRGDKSLVVHRAKKRNKERKLTYNGYINSGKWRRFRNSLIKERGNFCQKCKGEFKVLHGHHVTYERFQKELPEDVLLLCEQCHKRIHAEK